MADVATRLARPDLPAEHPQNVPLARWTDGWLKMSVASETDVGFLLANDEEKDRMGWPVGRDAMISFLVERGQIPAAGLGDHCVGQSQ